MAVSTTMDIYGVKQAVATLKELEPDYAKEMLKKVKQAGDPVLVAARSLIPTKPPLSGMGRGNLQSAWRAGAHGIAMLSGAWAQQA